MRGEGDEVEVRARWRSGAGRTSRHDRRTARRRPSWPACAPAAQLVGQAAELLAGLAGPPWPPAAGSAPLRRRRRCPSTVRRGPSTRLPRSMPPRARLPPAPPAQRCRVADHAARAEPIVSGTAVDRLRWRCCRSSERRRARPRRGRPRRCASEAHCAAASSCAAEAWRPPIDRLGRLGGFAAEDFAAEDERLAASRAPLLGTGAARLLAWAGTAARRTRIEATMGPSFWVGVQAVVPGPCRSHQRARCGADGGARRHPARRRVASVSTSGRRRERRSTVKPAGPRSAWQRHRGKRAGRRSKRAPASSSVRAGLDATARSSRRRRRA